MKFISSAIVLLLLNACSSFEIYDSSGGSEINGIPFFIKKGVTKQKTTYTRTWMEVGLEYHKLDGLGKNIPSSKRYIGYFIKPSTYHRPNLILALESARIKKGFENVVKNFETILVGLCRDEMYNCLINHQTTVSESDVTRGSDSLTGLLEALVSNEYSEEARVDYSRVYYFNTVIPPFGTNSATIKFAPEGTLTEATATADTKLSELVPLKELLVDKLKIGESDVTTTELTEGEEALVILPPPELVTISVNVSGYKYVLTKEYPLGIIPEDWTPLLIGDNSVSIIRTKFSDKTSGKEKPKDDKKSIKINGTIKLPE